MEVYEITEHIIRNPDYIEVLLENAGFCNIKDRGKEYRCSREEGTNPTGIKIKKDNLKVTCFSTGFNGNLIMLVREKMGFNFPQTLKWICDNVGLEYSRKNIKKVREPFGGFYKRIQGSFLDFEEELKTYSEDILDQFELAPNLMFQHDGIDFNTQTKFDIGYDCVSGRVTIPWRSFNHEIIGVMGRLNKIELSDDDSKYLPIYSFPKSRALFGYSHNYNSIQEKGTIILSEAEKGVMQLDSMGIHNGLGIGNCNPTDYQTRYINSLFADTIILAFDEGLDEEIVRENARKIKIKNKIYENHVGYILDKENRYLLKGSKYSPMDLGKDTFLKLLNEYVMWV